jgi:trans-aconitate 2-methyltransferase
MWSPEQYLRFADERSRPFHDLVSMVDHPAPSLVVDLGCGPGGLTASLLQRWPDAQVIGVDRSVEMIARARARTVAGRLLFEQADIAAWQSPRPVDVMVSNACLHWLPDHEAVLGHLQAQLAPGGVLAFQVPDNFSEPSHQLLRDMLAGSEWCDRLAHLPMPAVAEAAWYVQHLAGHGFKVNAWETTYYHVLQGRDAVLEWVKGTTLRPILAALDEPEQQSFLDAYGEQLRQAYPEREHGTIFPFRRIFVVAGLVAPGSQSQPGAPPGQEVEP